MCNDDQSNFLTPHPEYNDISTPTLQKLYSEADKNLSLFEELGSDADSSLHTWELQGWRTIGAELERRGIKPYSSPHLMECPAAELSSHLLGWNEYLTKTTTDQAWTVQNLLPDSGPCVLQGRGKQGKSTLVRHLA